MLWLFGVVAWCNCDCNVFCDYCFIVCVLYLRFVCVILRLELCYFTFKFCLRVVAGLVLTICCLLCRVFCFCCFLVCLVFCVLYWF